MKGKALIVGLTGQTGAGKTTVSGIFSSHGFAVIDCDQVARRVTEVGRPCLKELTESFGDGILDETGALRRREMGRLIFADPVRKARFEQIIFPYILKEIEGETVELTCRGEKAVILDAPTLFESGADRMCDKIVSVTAPKEQRVARIMERDGIDRELALLRVKAQHDETFFKEHSHLVLTNEGGLGELTAQAKAAALRIEEWCHG